MKAGLLAHKRDISGYYFRGGIMNLVDVLYKNARLYPSETSLVEIRPLSEKRIVRSWKQFNDRTSSFANALLEKGISKGERIFLLGRNSIDWIEAYFAVMKTGAWIVPLNFRFTDEDIEYCARVAEPAVFIFDKEFGERVGRIRPNLPSIKEYFCIGEDFPAWTEGMEHLIKVTSSAPPQTQLYDQDSCGLYFTSGTTGAPKPVLLTHENLLCTSITEATNHYLEHGDCFLMMPPLYHLAIGHFLGLLVVGGSTVLLTEKIDPKIILQTMSTEHISVVFLLVPWALDLLEAFDSGTLSKQDYDLSAWRLTHMGAQPIPPSVLHRLKAYFPDIQYDTNYGLSETAGPGCIHLGIENERKVGAIGKPSLMWDVRIVDSKDNDMPQGEVGEIIIKGQGVMKEYYKNPKLTAETIQNGWLRTGDLAKVDEEGFIYLVDRKKDLVISGGENIYPVEVEETILRHPKVHDVAVIGIPDQRLGEIAAAVIETKQDQALTEQEITTFCEENLPRFKRPRRILFDHVPRNPTGKIEKPKLREKYSQ